MEIYVSGDIHGNFASFFDYILERLSNALVIVAGDCGFGFTDEDSYLDLFDGYEKKFIDKHVQIYFVRGNHDDPEYFNTDHYENVRSLYQSFKLLPDYSVICGCILVVGGATSEDRDTRTIDVNYWFNEEVKKLTKLPSHINSNVKVIISHEAPSISTIQRYPMPPEFPVSIYTKQSMQADRDYLTKLFNTLHPELWIHGHYHRSSREVVQNCEFICCPRFEPGELDHYHLFKIVSN